VTIMDSDGDGSSFETYGTRRSVQTDANRKNGGRHGAAHRRRRRWRSSWALRVTGSMSPRPLRADDPDAAQAQPRLPTQGVGFQRAAAGVPAPLSSAVATGPQGTPSSSSSWRPDDPSAPARRPVDGPNMPMTPMRRPCTAAVTCTPPACRCATPSTSSWTPMHHPSKHGISTRCPQHPRTPIKCAAATSLPVHPLPPLHGRPHHTGRCCSAPPCTGESRSGDGKK
jgi:hypothetical protein